MDLTRRSLVTGGLGLAGAAAGPRSTRAQAPKRGGVITIRGWDPPHFDPMQTTAYRVHVPITFTHNRLLRHEAGPAVAPGAFPLASEAAGERT